MAKKPSPHQVFANAVVTHGGQTRFAEVCGCTQGNIWQLLRKQSPLPAQYVLKVESAFGISRHDLRPDLYPREEQAAA